MLFESVLISILLSTTSGFSRFSFLFNEQESCIPAQLAKQEFSVFFRELGKYEWKEPACNHSYISTYYGSQYIKLTWFDAFIFCKAFEMQLATFDTKVEQEYVLDMFGSNLTNNLGNQSFTGGTRIGRGKWYWISTGEYIDYKIRWKYAEPTNLLKDEECLSIEHIQKPFGLVSSDCQKSSNFICETFQKKTNKN